MQIKKTYTNSVKGNNRNSIQQYTFKNVFKINECCKIKEKFDYVLKL